MSGSVRNATSFWYKIKLWVAPIAGKLVNLIYIGAIIYLFLVTIWNGMYIVIPGWKNITDDIGLSKIFTPPELRDAVAEGDESDFMLFVKYVLFKNILLLMICILAKIFVFERIFGLRS